MKPVRLIFAAVCLLGTAGFATAQETIFNVPSADVLDRGKVYVELDMLARTTEPAFSFAPRIVIGAGHRIEVGANFNGIAEPATGTYTLAPTFKWKLYDGQQNGWSVLVGDNVIFPLRHGDYDVGTYSYLMAAKSLRTKTRVAAGAYYFSPNVVDRAQRAGGQFSVEQRVSGTLTLAADWFTGRNANGYFTPGVVWNTTKKFTTYAAYQIGNDPSNGNHGLLLEFGYNF